MGDLSLYHSTFKVLVLETESFCEVGNDVSEVLFMTKGIRQGTILSHHLFDIHFDELKSLPSDSKIGCDIGGKLLNNFSCADDLAILAPSVRALNNLLAICDDFAKKNLIELCN